MPKSPEPLEPPSPWLSFFRQIRALAAKLDELEAQERAENKS